MNASMKIGAGILTAAVLAGCATTVTHHAKAPPAVPAATQPAAPAAATAPTAGQKVLAWYGTGGSGALNGIVAALGQVQQQGEAGNLAGTGQACAQLATALTSAEALPPIPYPRAEQWFARALAKYQEAAANCEAGAASGDLTAITRATAEMGTADTYLAKTTSAIRGLS
ncbi:MAG: hypothetical protein ACLQFR_17345 [Streptosporangiaceae bacterium]